MRPVTAVANYLIQRALSTNMRLTGGQLHTLVYFAHGLRLALVNDPLLDEPVLGDMEGVLIQGLKSQGIAGEKSVTGIIVQLAKRADGRIDDDTPMLNPQDPAIATLDLVWTRFGSFTAGHLALFVRSSDSPWALAWDAPARNGQDTVILANSAIRAWFRALLIQENKDRASADGLEETVMMSKFNLAATLVPRKS